LGKQELTMSVTTARPPVDELIGKAEALVPTLLARARKAEEERRIPDETIAELDDSGLFLLVSPLSEGGYGYGLRELA
jgi:hypothetical protein